MVRSPAAREMEILIDDIPEEGLGISATESHRWLADAVRTAVGDAFDPDAHAILDLRITRIEGNVSIAGDVALVVHPPCDRCGKPFEERPTIPVHVTLAPLFENRRQQEREEGLGIARDIVREDLEFGYYEGDRFDLEELIREQAALAWPMKHLCREDCAGLCQRCGKDLNEGPCGCAPEPAKGPFATLAGVALPPTPKKRAKPAKTKKKAKPAKARKR